MNKIHAISTLAMALVILLGCVVYSFHRISETAVLHQAEVASLQEQIVPAPAEVVFVDIPVEVPVEVPYKIEVPVTVEVPVHKTPGEFASIDELETWLSSWSYVAAMVNGVVTFDSQDNDCDDWSRQMVRAASKDGYFMGLVLDEALSHMKVFTIIGNNIYYIEPQTGEINKSRFTLDK